MFGEVQTCKSANYLEFAKWNNTGQHETKDIMKRIAPEAVKLPAFRKTSKKQKK